MVAEQDHNRSEEATPFKREESRKKGLVAKSLDVNSLGMLAIALAGFYIFGAQIYRQELSLFTRILQDVPNVVFAADTMATRLSSYLNASIMVLAPLLALLLLGAIVTGLAGTGDSTRSKATRQTLANFMSNFDVLIAPEQVNSRNVAIVSVMALMPPVAHPGDRMDVTVTSMGDAHSLVGGTLLLAPLKGPDGKLYALAQGPVSVGGYRYDQFGNVAQKNHPTSGAISGGAQVEEEVIASALNADGSVNYLLADPDYTTAERVERALNLKLGSGYARVVDSGTVHITPPARFSNNRLEFVSVIEAILIEPDTRARVVVNEKTGTIVSGGEIKLSKVTIAHGDLRVSIQNRFSVSQPQAIYRPSAGIRTQVIPNTHINVNEEKGDLVELPESSSVGDLLHALKRSKASTRDTITILQGIKTAGALHADLIIQ